MPRPAAYAAALVTGLVLTAGLPSVAQAAPTDPTRTAIEVNTMVGPDDDIPCTVQADLYLPAGVDAAHKAPAILTTNGFGGAKDDSGQTAGANAFAKAGYVVISYSGLGFGGSGCKIYLDDPEYDGKAGKQMVDVLAGTKSYTLKGGTEEHSIDYVATDGPDDPKVGMIGGSYGGQIQFAVAGQDPRVDAIIPEITWNDLSYSLAPNNTDLVDGVTYRTPGVAKKDWIGLFFGIGIADGLQNTKTDPARNLGCPNFTDAACTAAAQLQTVGYPDPATLELARHASVSRYIDQITIPTLLVQGEHDTLFNLQEAVATYRTLKAQGAKVAMSWFSGGHSGDAVAGDLDLSGGVGTSHQGRRWISWMDRYVRGDTSASAGPEFEYFRDWTGSTASTIDQAYAASPSGFSGAPTSTLYLSGTDGLISSKSSVATGASRFAVSTTPTSYSETSGVAGKTGTELPPSDAPGTFASYTTAALTQDAVLVGSPRLDVRITAPIAATAQGAGAGGKLVLFAKLYDVAPDGTQKLQQRLISPVRIKDVSQPVQIELPAVAQRFAAGHQLRLVIAGGDAAYANNLTAQAVTVQTSRQSPGALTLPLVSPTTSPGGSCPRGTTGTQPFCTAPAATGTTSPAVPSAPGTAGGAAGNNGGGHHSSGTGGSQGGPAVTAGSSPSTTDRADALPETGAVRGLLAALGLGLALLAGGLVMRRRREPATAQLG